jgi:hypothetical protein
MGFLRLGMFYEIITNLGQSEGLRIYPFLCRSAIAKIALAPFRIVQLRLRNPEIAQLGGRLRGRSVVLPIQFPNDQPRFIELYTMSGF